VRNRIKETTRLILAVGLLLSTNLMAQVPSGPPPSSAGIYPLDQVHRGLRGVAYTVFEGTQPEAMDVEILGVLTGALGPGKDMILARLHGTKPEYTGVVAGMSGSPVYVDGKLMGALSYRIGEFSKEPIAGITPIEQMLEVRGEAASSTKSTGTAVSSTQGFVPIETPLVLSGYGPEAVKIWQDRFAGTGLMSVAGVGGGASTQAQPEPIVPGSAVSALLVRGDLQIAATCTTTYVDATQLLACGHPITQYGSVSMPMTKALVLVTLPSPLNAFKIVNTTETVGSITDDRHSAVRGSFGQNARMVPVTVELHGTNTPRTLHFEVIDQPQITPSALLVSVYQALMDSNGLGADTSFHIRGNIDVDGFPPVPLDNWVAPGENQGANLGAALMVSERFARLYSNTTRQASIRSVTLNVEAVPERRTMQLEGARTSSMEAHAGETITVEATVRPYRGAARNIRIPILLPASLPDGQIRLLISDGGTLDRVTQPNRAGARPLDMNATIAQIEGMRANDRLYVTLLTPAAQALLEGRTLPELPVSMANVLEPLRNSQEMTLNGESAIPVTSVAVDAVLSGQQVISLRID
jgi:SpoIVB peptidase S55